jgi:pimeloyl-ACP methyl ester carboxylesterase
MPDTTAVQQGFVELPGVRLFYESAGQGQPIVFLHGGLLDGRMWDAQFTTFAQHYRAIRYDMRCNGRSEAVPIDRPYLPYQDLRDLLRVLELPPATLVGLSGGARFAIDLAIAHPELVRGLVVVSPGLSGYPFADPWTQQRGAALQQALGQGDLAAAVEVFLTMWTDGPYRSPAQVDPAIRERLRQMATHALPLSRIAPKFEEIDPPAVGRLAEIQAPTLVVLGDRDTTDILAIGKLLHEQVSGSELVLLPDVGHILVMERPAQFNALLDRFLRSSL